MSSFVYKNPKVLFGGSTDFSAFCRSLTTNFSLDQQDATAGNAAGGKSSLPGMQDAKFEFEFLQDFAVGAGNVDQFLAATHTAKVAIAVEAAAVNSARSTSNPSYTITAFMFDYSPMDGAQVGNTAIVKATFIASPGVYTRATA